MAFPLHDDTRHYRPHGLPASTYNKLSRSDISTLTQILNHAPAKSDSSSVRAYTEIVRSLIAKLPAHLTNKLPWLSASCSLHHNIVSLPVISLLKALQYEVDNCTPDVWAPLRDGGVLTEEQKDILATLEDLSGLWMRPETFEAKYLRKPTQRFSSTKCACCVLAKIGGNEKAMTALGAFFIGRSDPSIWKKSKRIMWMESWIRNSIEDEKQEAVVSKMWTLGSALRKVRKEKGGVDRGYIDQFVEQTGADEEKRGQTHPQNADNERQYRELDAYLLAEDIFDDRPAADDEDDDPDENHAWLGDEQRFPYTASSIYSRDADDEPSVRRIDPRRDVTSGLLSLYRYTMHSWTKSRDSL